MKLSHIYLLIVIIAVILSFVYSYAIATSDLPDWMKFYFLK